MALGPNTLWSAIRVTSAGDLVGTGSIVSVPSETVEGWRWCYAVTAHHVVSNNVEIAVEVPDAFTGTLHRPLKLTDWRQPFRGVDLAIAPFRFALSQPFRGCHLEDQALPSNELPALAAPIFYIGIFEPLDMPVVRGGHLSSMPTLITKPNYEYHAHLVDCRSYEGFSGSPCYVELRHPVVNRRVKPPGPVPEEAHGAEYSPIASFAMLAGIFTAHFDKEEDDGKISRYGVGLMLPVRYIREALMTDEARQERATWDAERQAEKAAGGPELKDVAVQDVTDESSEFERFEDLTRKLVNTPKHKP